MGRPSGVGGAWYDFPERVEASVQVMRKVLGVERGVLPRDGVPDACTDKFSLAAAATESACEAWAQALGITGAVRDAMCEWARTGETVTLRLAATMTSTSVRCGGGGGVEQCVCTVRGMTVLSMYAGRVADAEGLSCILFAEEGCAELTTREKERSPHPAEVAAPLVELDVTWLARQLGGGVSIDRAAATCRTPRRNEVVNAAVRFARAVQSFVDGFRSYSTLFAALERLVSSLAEYRFSEVDLPTSPMLPLVMLCVGRAPGGSPPSPLPPADCGTLLEHYSHATAEVVRREQDRVASSLSQHKYNPSLAPVVTRPRGALLLAERVAQDFQAAVDLIEDMLHQQLLCAVGKAITAADFAEHMQRRYSCTYAEAYAPRRLAYAVRRPGYAPEGTISVVHAGSGDLQPVSTLTRRFDPFEGQKPLRFALHSTATVEVHGARYVHAYIAHRFAKEELPPLAVLARARQFSCYVVVLATMVGAETLLPSHAFVVENRDEFVIPLDAEALPTAQELRDAAAPLTPEQRRFAEAYRNMRLSATLLAVCVLEVKPLVEASLNLPEGSLTQHVELVETVVRLYREFQIPSDMLRYRPEEGAAGGVPAEARVAAVEENVLRVKAMVNDREKARRRAAQKESGDMEEERRFPEILHGAKEKKGKGIMSRLMSSVAKAADRRQRKIAPCDNNAESCHKDPSAPLQHPSARSNQSHTAPQLCAEPLASQGARTTVSAVRSLAYDLSQIPHILEARAAALGGSNCLRPTILCPAAEWRKSRQTRLLDGRTEEAYGADAQRHAMHQAFDLLDCVTRSGLLASRTAEVHFLVAATSACDAALLNAAVDENVHPDEAVQQAALLVASTLHEVQPQAMMRKGHGSAAAGTPSW